MSKTSSVVEVNGNRYDAITGELISKVKRVSASVSRPTRGRMVDGFVLKSDQKAPSPKKSTTPTTHPKVTSHGLHTGREKSQTLMRRAVKKPSSLKIVDPGQSKARSSSIDHVRESRAKTVVKHSRVNRFGFLPSSSAHGAQQTASVFPRPSLKVKRTKQSEVPFPKAPSMITSVSHQKLERILDEALVKASAHKQMMNGRRYSGLSKIKHLPKKLRVSITIFVFLLIAAILVWQNLPSVAVHVAAARAHVNASMPGYTPSGYSFANPIQYENGSLTMKYVDKNHAGDDFLLTQKASNWDSSSLAANALPKDVPVQTSQVNGTTVYVYGSSNDATWVNHGVVYSLQNKARLSSDQVMKIVNSL